MFSLKLKKQLLRTSGTLSFNETWLSYIGSKFISVGNVEQKFLRENCLFLFILYRTVWEGAREGIQRSIQNRDKNVDPF